ncbi:sugar-binding transcriptional regulator [Morganella morganii]|uniref:sugar-binding transcriptional regulator n=1 Tax=Morganella morganii TaxID=582 RepID=UPI0034D58251
MTNSDNRLTGRLMFGNDPVLQAAWLYYQSGLSQTEVADVMGISRVTVVKYLQTARENGVVHISLDMARYSRIDMALSLKKKFNLTNVLVVPDSPVAEAAADSARRRENMAQAAGVYLSQVIEDGDVLGVAWGRTIHHMAKCLTPKVIRNMTVLQMLGSVPSQPDFTTVESSSLIAGKFGGECAYLHVPAIVSSAELADALRREPIIQANFAQLDRCTKALFVAGNVTEENPLIRAGVITAEEMTDFRRKGAVGVICGRFYDQAGEPLDTHTDARILGIRLPQLRNIARRIFIATGEQNIAATRGALYGGYVSDLIVDPLIAAHLLSDK